MSLICRDGEIALIWRKKMFYLSIPSIWQKKIQKVSKYGLYICIINTGKKRKNCFWVEAQVSFGKIQNDLTTQLLMLASVKQALKKTMKDKHQHILWYSVVYNYALYKEATDIVCFEYHVTLFPKIWT